MAYLNKCRVCLEEGAKHQIFENIKIQDSIYCMFLHCFKEKVEDIDGYPRKICEACKNMLHSTNNFITKYKRSCKLLEGSLTVKTEVCSDYEHSDYETFKEVEIDICKDEPDSDWIEPLDDSIWNIPLTQVKKQETSLSQIKAKLKNLKEINFKRKSARKDNRKNHKVASSILEAEFNWNGESLKSSKIRESKEEKPKEKSKHRKLDLPKPPKVPQPPEPRPKLCDLCGEIFEDSDKMSRHKQNKHMIVKMKCPKCPQILHSKRYLTLHIKRVHEFKPLICDMCGKRFSIKASLSTHIQKVHLKTMKAIKKHICGTCNKAFYNTKSLIIHERSAHTGFRPAECKECGACFFHEDYLKEHMRLHTGETPFKCPICDRGYAQRGNMISHISHNHRLTDLNEETIKNLKPSWFKYLKKP